MKLFKIILIFTYLNCCIGCYYNTKPVRVGINDLDSISVDKNIEVVTTNKVNYLITAGNYQVKGDTLIAKLKNENIPQYKLIKIPLVEIEKVNRLDKETNILGSTLLIIGTLSVLIPIGGFIILSAKY